VPVVTENAPPGCKFSPSVTTSYPFSLPFPLKLAILPSYLDVKDPDHSDPSFFTYLFCTHLLFFFVPMFVLSTRRAVFFLYGIEVSSALFFMVAGACLRFQFFQFFVSPLVSAVVPHGLVVLRLRDSTGLLLRPFVLV